MLKNKGITLIALVVTIVVLLILAGVSITAVFGENGIISGAQKAKEKTDESIKQEQEDVGKLVNQLEEFERESLPDTVKEAIQKGTIFAVNKQIKDETGKTMTVPKGFKVKEGTTIDEGVVIADSEGNEFVWVPCEDGAYKKHEYEVKQVNDTSSTADGENKDKGWNTIYYRKYSDWKDDEVDETENKKSVQNNGGFYIARYEAGVPSNADFYVDESTSDKSYKDANSKDTTQTKNGENLKPVSKAGNQCWNLISQINAKEVSGKMYSGDSYGVRSQLVDGTAWDTVVTWISKDSNYSGIEKNSLTHGNYADSAGKNQIIEENCLFAEHLYNSTSKTWCIGKNYQYGLFTSGYTASYKVPEGEGANYNGYDSDEKCTYAHYVEMATGVSNNTKLKNIYDMAGNMYEWTTEYGYHGSTSSSTKYAVRRGGSFWSTGTNCPVSYRLGDVTATVAGVPSFGFRVVLYVK